MKTSHTSVAVNDFIFCITFSAKTYFTVCLKQTL